MTSLISYSCSAHTPLSDPCPSSVVVTSLFMRITSANINKRKQELQPSLNRYCVIS